MYIPCAALKWCVRRLNAACRHCLSCFLLVVLLHRPTSSGICPCHDKERWLWTNLLVPQQTCRHCSITFLSPLQPILLRKLLRLLAWLSSPLPHPSLPLQHGLHGSLTGCDGDDVVENQLACWLGGWLAWLWRARLLLQAKSPEWYE